ncbi:META domain-containing protein [Blastococcus sp. CT_GayMR16]|uniref:META domain-containing protein n=1 Tax=Blastococcus sp. CT_GayMR16 TaxID=2559607 RepID=UPI00142F626B|nr:META domain-containing protein [Blastococcus sp. CT_GayMR16]
MPRALLVLVAALLVAGCAERAGTASELSGEWFLVDGSADGGALPQPAGAGATLTVGPDELSGRSFCNHYSSTYSLDGTTLAVDGLGGTDMGCEPAVMAAEAAYLGALGRADTVARDGEDLLLTGDGVRLRFSLVPPVPDRELAGTRWVLDTLVDGDVASSTLGEPAVLLLEPDSTADASTGCRAVTGTWLVEDGALVIDDLLVTGTCPPDVEPQDAHVTAVLSSGPAVEISEDRLTLTAPDGRGLVYRAG